MCEWELCRKSFFGNRIFNKQRSQGHVVKISRLQLGDFTTQTLTDREAESRQSGIVSFVGKVAADTFTCDKHLISGITLRFSFLRKRPKFFSI